MGYLLASPALPALGTGPLHPPGRGTACAQGPSLRPATSARVWRRQRAQRDTRQSWLCKSSIQSIQAVLSMCTSQLTIGHGRYARLRPEMLLRVPKDETPEKQPHWPVWREPPKRYQDWRASLGSRCDGSRHGLYYSAPTPPSPLHPL